MAPPAVNVAVVGATGLVGAELLRLFKERKFPIGKLDEYNSKRPPTIKALKESKLVFFVSSDEVSRRYAPALSSAGVWVIDDSAAFRLDARVPLVLPEVNGDKLNDRQKLIAGPNCTLTGAALACAPLIKQAGARALRIASYQSVSGAGKEALAEYKAQVGGGKKVSALPRRIFGNVFPQVGSFDGEGHSSEERKVRDELRKILGIPELPISATAVRVPVERGHSLAVWLETQEPLAVSRARALLQEAPGVKMWPANNYPTPLDAQGTEPVHVGRLRHGAFPNELCFWVVSDNLLKGAALNSIQIAELLIEKNLL